MTPAERFRLDPRRLLAVEATELELAGRGEPLPAADAARLAEHRAAQRDDALRRNTVPRGEASRAALANPSAAAHDVLNDLPLSALVTRERHTRDWVRTKLGDEVLALIEKDRNT